jgi:arylsulfatase A-like enzyme
MNAIRRGDEPINEPNELEYTTDQFTDAAINFIDRCVEESKEPFFIYLAHNAVHGPMHGKPEILAQLTHIEDMKRRTYAAMTVSLDQNVGRVLDALNEHEIERETLIIFINDNGGATGNGSDNGPLRGMKGSKWEGGIRVPFIVRWPSVLPGGTTYDHPVISLDVLPTVLTAAGGDVEAINASERPFDGVDLIPYLSGERSEAPHEILFWRRGVAAAVRQGPWKLIRSEGNPTLLFNLDDDLSETTNLAETRPEIVARLTTALETWESELAPPKWREGDVWEQNQIMKHRMDVIGREMERRYP